MDCDILSRYADLYLDGELALEERAEVEAHLNNCTSCRESVTGEVRLRKRIRDSMLTARAPSSLRDQVSRRLVAERKKLDRPRFLPTLSYAVAVLMLAVMGYAVMFMVGRGADPADEAVVEHMSLAGSEVFGDSVKVGKFLEARAPFAYRVPIAESEGIELVGARVTNLGSRPAVVYLYDVGGRRVSVAQYESSAEARGPAPTMGHKSGFVVATYGDDSLTQTVVGDIPEPEVRRIIPVSYGQ